MSELGSYAYVQRLARSHESLCRRRDETALGSVTDDEAWRSMEALSTAVYGWSSLGFPGPYLRVHAGGLPEPVAPPPSYPMVNVNSDGSADVALTADGLSARVFAGYVRIYQR